jgi:hypothetical protein
MRDLMSNDQRAHRPGHRRRRWWRRLLSPLPQKLTSRKFNIYQVALAAILSYLAFRIFLRLFLNDLDTPPE